jgi:glutathione synthase/RimK-type ligase-like ATP-grasp enzyme
MRNIVVVNSPRDWEPDFDGVEVVAARSYLTEAGFADIRGARIFNLCRSYRYQSTGYYVSLLAEARGHRAIPSVATIQDLKSQAISRVISEDIDEVIQKSLSAVQSQAFELAIYFGRTPDRAFERLATPLANLFQAPFLRASFTHSRDRWLLRDLSPIPVNEVPPDHRDFMMEAARSYFARKRLASPRIASPLYDLAILVEPEEEEPPSDRRAIRLFVDQGEELGIRCELITRDDFSRIPEFDGLFIRATTAVNHYTYRFSRRTFAEGLVVIDDPRSILQCANKVYLAEALARARIPTPRTVIVHRENQDALETALGLPCVLKRPDSSFSRGVIKVDDPRQLKAEVNRLLEASDLIIAQEFVPTPFDWRIGVLDREPLFACKYFMAAGHWQIYNWQAERRGRQVGGFESVPVYQVPKPVLRTAVKAANLIGDGLYGVDLKQIERDVRVIEVNDNPSIESGVEDRIMGESLYRTVMRSFRDRIERARRAERIPL